MEASRLGGRPFQITGLACRTTPGGLCAPDRIHFSYTQRVKTLVTGGTGYIGSHVFKLLSDRGDDVVIVDDLLTGDRNRVPGVPVVELDLHDPSSVAKVAALLDEHEIDSVVHFAGRKQVLESVHRPAWYYQQNLGGLANLLIAMETAKVTRLVFSSSAAVYGATEGEAITEDDRATPINPYGETKLIGEQMIARATAAFPLDAVSLRYFNVAGAGTPDLGDRAVLNLVPMVFEKIDQGEQPVIFGDDYSTPDGTCIRDYIHVQDLAEAHIAVLDHLGKKNDTGHEVFNVGTGTGTSVKEMVSAILSVSNSSLEPKISPRREGDPAWVVASPDRIASTVGWTSRLGLQEIVESAWQAHELHRAGIR
jgi:UDP-glucose 4-epimerase